MKDLLLRPEKPEEQHTMESIIRDAFWDKYSPGCCEHLLVNRLRHHPKLIPSLCLAAEYKSELAGGIWYAEAVIIKQAEACIPVLTMGPVGVRPDLQGRGIGAELIRKTLSLASQMSYPAVLIYGNLNYYSRFGFQSAANFNITDGEGNFCPAIQVYPIGQVPAGAFLEGDAYQITADEAREFDRQFPHKQRHLRSSQLFFVPPGPPPSDPLFLEAWQIRRRASDLLRRSGIIEAWESIGAKIRTVGSYRNGLMHDQDIDLHVYTDTLDPATTLKAFATIFTSPSTIRYTYINGAETDEQCLEWHLSMKDDSGDDWTIDMIQILAGSALDGFFEDTAEAIVDSLTDESRKTILTLKKAAPPHNSICGIEFYKAVLKDHVRTWDDFVQWRKQNPLESMYDWRP